MPPQPQPPLPPPSPIQEQYERQERSVITTSSKHEESSQMQRNEYLGHQQHTVDQEQQVQRQQEQEQRQIQKKTDLRALSASPTMYDFSKSRVRPPTPRPFVPFCAAAEPLPTFTWPCRPLCITPRRSRSPSSRTTSAFALG